MALGHTGKMPVPPETDLFNSPAGSVYMSAGKRALWAAAVVALAWWPAVSAGAAPATDAPLGAAVSIRATGALAKGTMDENAPIHPNQPRLTKEGGK